MAAEKQVPQIEMMDPNKKARLDKTIAHLKKRQMGVDTPDFDLDSTDDTSDSETATATLEITDTSHLESDLGNLKRRQAINERIEEHQKIPELRVVTEDVLNDYDDNQRFVKKFTQTASTNLNGLTPAQRISFFEMQIKELTARNDELLEGINRKITAAERLNQTANLEILTNALHDNQARIADLDEKIAEEELYQAELPKFIEQEVTNLAEAGGLTKEQITDLYSDNFITKLLGKGYTPGNWEKTQALLNAEVKARAAAELAIFNFEFPGVKLDANGEPQIGFLGKLTGKLNKIKASESYQNYRAFTKLANHILEAEAEPVPARPNTSKMRSVGKIALAATAAAAIGGPVGERAAEITKHVSDSVSSSFVKKENKSEQKKVQAPEITSADFPDVVIAPTNIPAQDSDSETRRRRKPLENFTEEELGQAINFAENEGTEVVDTTASTRRAEARKAQAIKTAFVAPKTQTDSSASISEPERPTVNLKPVGSKASEAKARAISKELFGEKFDEIIKKPILREEEKEPIKNTIDKEETPVKRPSLSLSESDEVTQNTTTKETDRKIKKALREASVEEAQEVAKRIAATGRSLKTEEAASDQDEEETTPSVEVASVRPRRGLIDLKSEASETKLPEISAILGAKSVKITEAKSSSRDQVRTALSEAGKEAATKIKESLTLRETLRASLKNSGLTKVEQDAYFYTATKKFDSLSKKPAERAKFVAQIQKAADAGVDQLIEMLNQ